MRAAIARWQRRAAGVRVGRGEASRADVVLSALAADAIDLVTEPNTQSLRVWGSSRLFVKRTRGEVVLGTVQQR